jgi:hypothetical protein
MKRLLTVSLLQTDFRKHGISLWYLDEPKNDALPGPRLLRGWVAAPEAANVHLAVRSAKCTACYPLNENRPDVVEYCATLPNPSVVPEKSGFSIPLPEGVFATGVRIGFESRGRILWAAELHPYEVKTRTRGVNRKIKPALVLHVGPHKTGSTAVQDFFFHHRAELAEFGFWYPAHALFGSQHALLPVSLLDVEHPYVDRELLHGDFHDLLASIIADLPRHHVTILSTEVIWELLTHHPDKASKLFRCLNQIFDVHIFFVDRNHFDRDWSNLKHAARDGFPIDVTQAKIGDPASFEICLRWLEATEFPIQRVAFDAEDAVIPFLETLGASMARFTPDPKETVKRVNNLIEARRNSPPQECRVNEAPKLAAVAAFTFKFSERLSRIPEDLRPPRKSIAEFLRRFLEDSRVSALLKGLPPERELQSRLLGNDTASRTLLSEEETRHWESALDQSWVRELCAEAGCGDLTDRLGCGFFADA